MAVSSLNNIIVEKEYKIPEDTSPVNFQTISNELIAQYNFPLPDSFDVFSNIDFHEICKNEQVNCKSVKLFFVIFRRVLEQAAKENVYVSSLPKMGFKIDSDYAVVFEWSHPCFQIYFSLEQRDESSFYGMYYMPQGRGGIIRSESSKFLQAHYDEIITLAVERVLEFLRYEE